MDHAEGLTEVAGRPVEVSGKSWRQFGETAICRKDLAPSDEPGD
jgi:hypothetical protein